MIHTHSHVDHYGGVKGVVSEAEVKAGKLRIIAPEGFLKAALDENVTDGRSICFEGSKFKVQGSKLGIRPSGTFHYSWMS